jgi:hypothetical protein
MEMATAQPDTSREIFFFFFFGDSPAIQAVRKLTGRYRYLRLGRLNSGHAFNHTISSSFRTIFSLSFLFSVIFVFVIEYLLFIFKLKRDK